MAHARVAPLIAGALLCSCTEAATETPPPNAPAPVAATAAASGDFQASRWGDFRSKRFQIALPLPDGKAWRIDDHTSPWLTATHAGTSSQLSVRLWAEEERATNKSCEAKARSWKKMPDRQSAEGLERAPTPVPPEFDTEVEIGWIPPAEPGGVLSGFVRAFGGRRHRCFAYVFTTEAKGAGAEKIVGARLAVMAQGSLRAMRVDDALHPQVQKAPPIEPARREAPSIPPP